MAQSRLDRDGSRFVCFRSKAARGKEPASSLRRLGLKFDDAAKLVFAFIHFAPFNEGVRLSQLDHLFRKLVRKRDSMGPAAATQLGCVPGSSVSTIATPRGGCTDNPISLTSSWAVFKTSHSLVSPRRDYPARDIL
jgi:hypothetical protein